jgi:hypothetical protein
VVAPPDVPVGLARGLLLVDEITTLKQASVLHGQQNKTEQAYRIVRALKKKFADTRVSGLEKERVLIDRLDATLTRLSGHRRRARAREPARRADGAAARGLPVE